MEQGWKNLSAAPRAPPWRGVPETRVRQGVLWAAEGLQPACPADSSAGANPGLAVQRGQPGPKPGDVKILLLILFLLSQLRRTGIAQLQHFLTRPGRSRYRLHLVQAEVLPAVVKRGRLTKLQKMWIRRQSYVTYSTLKCWKFPKDRLCHLRGSEIPQENIYCISIIPHTVFLGKLNDSNYH